MDDVELLKLASLPLLLLDDLPNDSQCGGRFTGTRHATDVEGAAAPSLLDAVDDVVLDLDLLHLSAGQLIRLSIELQLTASLIVLVVEFVLLKFDALRGQYLQ